MKTLALAFVALVMFAQVPQPGTNGAGAGDLQSAPQAAKAKPPTLEELQAQVAQLQQQVAQKDQQIAAMSAQLTASGKMFSACFQSLAEAEQRAAANR